MSERTNGERPVRSRRRGISAKALWALMALVLVSGVVALATLWYLRPDDGPVRLIEPAPLAGDAFTFAGSFPPAGGTPLRNPRGVDVLDGFVYVTEADAGDVVVYGTDGRRVTSWKVPPVAGAKAYPVDIAAISKDRVAVVDTTGHRVVVLSLNSAREPISVAVLGEGEGALKNPTAVAASEGRLYVADADRGEVLVFGTGNEVEAVLGSGLQPPLSFVGGLSVRADHVWATDANAGRVLRLSATGKAAQVTVDRAFDLPRGVAVDRVTGRVVIADVFASRLLAFRPGGEYVGETTGDELGGATSESELERPEDVAWDAGHLRVYVTDSGSGTVKVFNVVTRR